MLFAQGLRVVWAVEIFAFGIPARTGVISTDNQMRAAVILANDRVPERLSRSTHAHRERQQTQHGRLLGIVLEDVLVAANARVVVDIARLGHADHRMDQQIGFNVAGRAK